MLDAVRRGHEALQVIIELQDRVAAAIGRAKRQVPVFVVSQAIKDEVTSVARTQVVSALYNERKEERESAMDAVKAQVLEHFASRTAAGEVSAKDVSDAFQSEVKYLTRKRILDDGIRPDLRDLTTIRPISCEVGVLPRPHGSGLFTRGQTQVLTVCTLGPGTDEQMIDDITSETKKRLHASLQLSAFQCW